MEIFDISWQFTIPHATFIQGGKATYVPKWAPNNHYRDTWHDNGVNCAAYALIRLMENTRPSPRQLSKSKHKFIQEAEQLQSEFGW
jgi:hypothetical protein